MRYLLALLVVVAAFGAAWLLASSDQGQPSEARTGLPSPTASGAAPKDAALDLRARPARQAAVPTQAAGVKENPTPSRPEQLTRREILIGRAGNYAGAMGETCPQLHDFHRTDVRGAKRLLAAHGAGDGYIGPDDKQVYLVRMRGSFKPLTGPPAATSKPPGPGIMFIVYDAETGGPLVVGYSGTGGGRANR